MPEKRVNITKGIFGLQIKEKLAKEIWMHLKPYAKYHSGGEDDMDWADDQYPSISSYEIRGWYYQDEIIKTLQNLGWDVYLYGELLPKQ